MKLTVIVANEGSACNVGGPVTYRRITVDLTPEQTRALTLHDRWESHGTTLIELDDADRLCSCPFGREPYGARDDGTCHRCGKPVPAARGTTKEDDRGA